MSAEWYYALGDQQKGPIAEDELRSMLLGGNLPVDIKVWSKGMSDWASAEKVPALYRPAPPSPEPVPVVQPKAAPSTASASVRSNPFASAAETISGGSGSRTPAQSARMRLAWNRFLARLIDYHLVMILLSLLVPVESASEVTIANLLFSALVTFGVLAIFESYALSKWGMTPGKWIFRIRVVHEENRLLTYGEAFRRAVMVMVQGMCLGLFPMNLLFQGLAFKEYVDHGSTAWDRKMHSTLQHATMRNVHVAIAVAVCLLILAWFSTLPGATG
ncbi:MAG: RDD family protein [Planctomycetota bacterium]